MARRERKEMNFEKDIVNRDGFKLEPYNNYFSKDVLS
jgi:hypothetical protein